MFHLPGHGCDHPIATTSLTPVPECRLPILQTQAQLPKDGGRYSIHDVIFDDINGSAYTGPDHLAGLHRR